MLVFRKSTWEYQKLIEQTSLELPSTTRINAPTTNRTSTTFLRTEHFLPLGGGATGQRGSW